MTIAKKGATLEDRLQARAHPNSATGCIEWGGYRNEHGYGRIIVGGKVRFAHRVAYELYVEPLKDGFCIAHKCDNPSCLNPEHLFQTTHAGNMADMRDKGRSDKVKKAKGASHWRAKLTENQAAAIKADIRPLREIASQYQLNKSTVYMLKTGRTWKHLQAANV